MNEKNDNSEFQLWRVCRASIAARIALHALVGADDGDQQGNDSAQEREASHDTD